MLICFLFHFFLHSYIGPCFTTKGNLIELVDPNLGSNFSKEEAVRILKVALLCTNPLPAFRPIMSAVVSMLEGRIVVHELIMDPNIYGDKLRFKALRDQFDQILG